MTKAKIAKIAKHIDKLEEMLEKSMAFQIINSVNTNIAIGPNPMATEKNAANMVALENARRSIAVMRELWGIVKTKKEKVQ